MSSNKYALSRIQKNRYLLETSWDLEVIEEMCARNLKTNYSLNELETIRIRAEKRGVGMTLDRPFSTPRGLERAPK